MQKKNFRRSVGTEDVHGMKTYMEGYLEKKSRCVGSCGLLFDASPMNRKGRWQKRWFRTNNHYLLYYSKEPGDLAKTKPSATLDLREVSCQA